MMSSTAGEPAAASRTSDDVEVAVIGAGQAGLAMGYFLRRQGRRFVILERADSIGSAWRERWESLTLFTPRRYSALPGLPVPGRPGRLPDPRRGDRLPRALRRDLRPADRAQQRGHAARAGRRRALPPRARRADDHRRPGRGRDRALPDAVRAEARREARGRCLPDARRRLPPARRRAEGDGPRRRRRQHRLPDREGALGDAQGRALGRLSPEAAAAARARARPLLVADEDGHHRQDGRVAARAGS